MRHHRMDVYKKPRKLLASYDRMYSKRGNRAQMTISNTRPIIVIFYIIPNMVLHHRPKQAPVQDGMPRAVQVGLRRLIYRRSLQLGKRHM